jgi:EAL domain-containing protein (putative c-di-GMP-specific phosphodiesterase class I)
LSGGSTILKRGAIVDGRDKPGHDGGKPCFEGEYSVPAAFTSLLHRIRSVPLALFQYRSATMGIGSGAKIAVRRPGGMDHRRNGPMWGQAMTALARHRMAAETVPAATAPAVPHGSARKGLPTEPDALADQVEAALAENRILPFYQPMLDLASGDIAGFEALARWQHPEFGLLAPAAFAGAFEQQRLAVAIGQRIMARVCDDMSGFERLGAPLREIALNVSYQELREGSFAASLGVRLDTVGLDPRRVIVELGRGIDFSDPDDKVPGEIRRLAGLGVRIALDDFGTGFASLTQLRRMQADRIKIDPSFIARIEDDPEDAALVAGLIGLAHRLGMKTVAEGVERPAQLAFLREEGCDFAQGYLLGRPMPAAAVPHFAAGVLAA